MIPVVREAMKSPDASDRARAAFLLGQIGWRGSSGLLVKGMKDTARSVRVQSGIALACMGDARGVPVCALALVADEPWVRCYAVYGLWCVNGSQARHVLKNNLRGQGVLVTRAINGALSCPHEAPPPVGMTHPSKAKPLDADEVIGIAADMYSRESDWWWHQGDFEQSVRAMQSLVFIDPGDVQSFALIAWLQTSLHRPAEAVQTLNRLVAANPRDPDAYYELGLHYMNAKDFAHAEAPLRKSVELGDDKLVRRLFAHCLEGEGKLNECLDQWTIILQALPNDAAAQYNHDRIKKLLDAGSGK